MTAPQKQRCFRMQEPNPWPFWLRLLLLAVLAWLMFVTAMLQR
jgi:hypothetical protein